MTMRSAIRTSLVVALLAAALLAGYLFSSKLGLWSGHPEIEFPATLDLGKHEVGDQVVKPYVIANRGRADLVISEIRTSASCSCAGLERLDNGQYVRIEALTIPPGAHADLVLRFAVRGAPIGGPLRNVLELQTNDPKHPVARIEFIVDYVSGGFHLSPGAHVFGIVPRGAKVQQVVEVRDKATSPRTIERISSTDRRIQVELLPIEKLANADSTTRTKIEGPVIGRFRVTVQTDVPGRVDANVEIHPSGLPRKPDLFPVTGQVASDIEIGPSMVILPRQSSKGPLYNATCICRSTSGKPLSLSVETIPAGVSVRILDHIDRASKTVVIDISPPDAKQAGEERHVVRFRARVDNNETVVELPILVATLNRRTS